MVSLTNSEYWLTRFTFQRLLGFIYLIGFLIALNQFRPLAGEKGILPAQLFIKRVSFWDSPSLFWINSSDQVTRIVACLGILLALIAMSGFSEKFGMTFSVVVWSLLWILYLSFVNIGQVWYGFGWEILLLETGFLAIFLGSVDTKPPEIIIWLLRWILFRLMFGAGMIKLRGDPCWRDLTCMYHHYETQPLPNPLSPYFHRLPGWIHKGEILFTHFVELVVPWFYFVPGVLGYAAGILTILFQLTLILSGNLSWLNYITIVVAFSCFDDRFLSYFFSLQHPINATTSYVRQGILIALTIGIIFLSIRPARNLISRRQMMNASFEPLHLVNTYGAFGSITRERYEIILEGTRDEIITSETKWKEYEFKGKPGNVHRMPVIVSPYHYKLDWQMWFAAMSSFQQHPWILNLVAKLLHGDLATLSLMKENPFRKEPPKYIRAELYRYRFPTKDDHTSDWWKREWADHYMPPLSLDNPSFQELLMKMGWEAPGVNEGK